MIPQEVCSCETRQSKASTSAKLISGGYIQCDMATFVHINGHLVHYHITQTSPCMDNGCATARLRGHHKPLQYAMYLSPVLGIPENPNCIQHTRKHCNGWLRVHSSATGRSGGQQQILDADIIRWRPRGDLTAKCLYWTRRYKHYCCSDYQLNMTIV